MIYFDNFENKTEHKPNWTHIPDKLYRILIIGCSESGKTNVLLNLIDNQPDIDKRYLHAKDSHEAKFQYLIKIREKVGIHHHNDARAYTEYSNDMHDAYKNIGDYNPEPENETLIVFDDMISNMIHNKKLDSKVTELFIRAKKLNISLVFITQSYFKVPKDVRLNTTHFLAQKFQIIESLKKLREIIYRILELKISLISIENVLLNHILL